MATIYHNIHLADPDLRTDWRHNRVLQMLSTNPPGRCNRYDDKWIQQYKTFMLLHRKSDESRIRLLYEMPGLYYAYKLFDAINRDTALIVESRLLAGMTYAQIADLIKTIPETIEWYERLYFNVTEFLANRDWILTKVLLPSVDRYHDTLYETKEDDDVFDKINKKMAVKRIVKPHLDMTLKYFSYFGGPHVCDMMISGFTEVKHVTSVEDVPDFIHKNFVNTIARRSLQAASQFDINQYNVLELFSLHGKIIEVMKEDKSKSEKLNSIEKQFQSFLTDIPWATGMKAQEIYEGKLIAEHDKTHYEVNAEEALVTGSGQNIEIDVPPKDLFNRAGSTK